MHSPVKPLRILSLGQSWGGVLHSTSAKTFILKCEHVRMHTHFNHAQLSATLWTVARQAPLSMGFCRQEYWSGLQPSSRGSSQPRDHSHISNVSYIGRSVLYHWSLNYIEVSYLWIRCESFDQRVSSCVSCSICLLLWDPEKSKFKYGTSGTF